MKPTAVVRVSYMDDGPAFAGAAFDAIHRQEDVLLSADTVEEAERKAVKHVKKNMMASEVHARFKGWQTDPTVKIGDRGCTQNKRDRQ